MLNGMWTRGACLICMLGAAPALADVPRTLFVESDGCPDAQSVSSELQALLPHSTFADVAGAIRVHVSDEGERYRVTTSGTERTLEDPKRRCADRAHAVAVVVDLILAPPRVEELPRPARRRYFVDLAASGRLELGPGAGSGGVLVTGGAELRLDVGWRFIAASLGVRGLAPVTESFSVGSARLTRVPIDVGARAAWRRGRLELSGTAAFSAAALLVEGRDLSPARSTARFDPAARLVVGLRWWFSARLGVELAAAVDVALHPLDVLVDPVGVVGQTPRVWIGFGLGPVFRVRKP
jgi:hypothetical protein